MKRPTKAATALAEKAGERLAERDREELMHYQMVIQGDSRSIADYDAMLVLEEKIEQRIGEGVS
jgi:hypothetical protein